MTTYPITPVPAPRMTRSDKWKKRPVRLALPRLPRRSAPAPRHAADPVQGHLLAADAKIMEPEAPRGWVEKRWAEQGAITVEKLQP